MPLSDHVRDWRPGPITREDLIEPAPAHALANVLDHPTPAPANLPDHPTPAPANLPGHVAPGAPLPPLWHWLYFLDWPAQSALGEDGHPARGDFLPPVPDRRRMFAGGRLHVHAPLLTGRPAVRVAAVSDVTAKTGTSGELLFVTVRSEYRQDGALCLVEEQDLVYRSGDAPRSPARPATTPEPVGPWRSDVTATPPLLFRFSALTANTHRIHYDQHYARNVEGYPDLVVHGPLLAVLMAELPRRHAPVRPVTALTYRFRRPVFAGEPIVITGDPRSGRLTTLDTSGTVRADATVTFA